eukprot:8200042-Alexandrium_andersonii.AAC.1
MQQLDEGNWIFGFLENDTILNEVEVCAGPPQNHRDPGGLWVGGPLCAVVVRPGTDQGDHSAKGL